MPKHDEPESGRVRIVPVDTYRWMPAASHNPFEVMVVNEGPITVPSSGQDDQPIRVSYHWRRRDGERAAEDGVRTGLPHPLRQGESCQVPVIVRAPATPGNYVLEFDLVHEGVRWFGCDAAVEMTIDPPRSTRLFDRDSRVPAVLANVDPGLVDRLARISGLDVDEIGRRLLRPGPPVEIPVLSLGSRRVRLRPGSSDVRVLDLTFSRKYHLPPDSIGRPRLIVDVGANVGLTMAHFAHLFPRARVVGVEMDSANAALCRANVAPWSRRCSVVEAAVFARNGRAPYRKLPGNEWGYRLGDVGPGEGELVWVRTLTLDALLDSVPSTRQVDFMKVDVEGAERDLFQVGGNWINRVTCLTVETHEPYSPQECAADLARLGYEAAADDRHWGQSVIAFRPGVRRARS